MKTKDADTASAGVGLLEPSSISSEEVKKAEQRGYSRGYARGQQRKKLAISNEHYRRHEEARKDRFFCAALTGLLGSHSRWSKGDQEYKDVPGYVHLAKKFAEEALKQMRF